MWYSFENFHLIRKYIIRFHSPCTSSCILAHQTFMACALYISLIFFVYQMPPFTYSCVHTRVSIYCLCALYSLFSRYYCFNISCIFLNIRGRFYLAFLLTVFFFLLDNVHIQCASSVTFFGYCFLAVATSYQAKHMADVYWGESLFFYSILVFVQCLFLFFCTTKNWKQHKSISLFSISPNADEIVWQRRSLYSLYTYLNVMQNSWT
jgi:hypothetical protein